MKPLTLYPPLEKRLEDFQAYTNNKIGEQIIFAQEFQPKHLMEGLQLPLLIVEEFTVRVLGTSKDDPFDAPAFKPLGRTIIAATREKLQTETDECAAEIALQVAKEVLEKELIKARDNGLTHMRQIQLAQMSAGQYGFQRGNPRSGMYTPAPPPQRKQSEEYAGLQWCARWLVGCHRGRNVPCTKACQFAPCNGQQTEAAASLAGQRGSTPAQSTIPPPPFRQ